MSTNHFFILTQRRRDAEVFKFRVSRSSKSKSNSGGVISDRPYVAIMLRKIHHLESFLINSNTYVRQNVHPTF